MDSKIQKQICFISENDKQYKIENPLNLLEVTGNSNIITLSSEIHRILLTGSHNKLIVKSTRVIDDVNITGSRNYIGKILSDKLKISGNTNTIEILSCETIVNTGLYNTIHNCTNQTHGLIKFPVVECHSLDPQFNNSSSDESEESEYSYDESGKEKINLINSFPVSLYNPLKDKVDTCSICLCLFRKGNLLKTLNCKHKFHKSCLDLWLEKNFICPICRNSLI